MKISKQFWLQETNNTNNLQLHSIKSFYAIVIFKQVYSTHRWDPNRQCKDTPHSQNFQNWSLNIRYSFVSYPNHPIFGSGVLFLNRGYSHNILNLTDRMVKNLGYFTFRENEYLIKSLFSCKLDWRVLYSLS